MPGRVDATALMDEGDLAAESFDGVKASALRDLLGVSELHLFASAGSTLDVAHRLAASGAAHGTLVLADAQTRGRGRGGKAWTSPAGVGLWLTLIARPGRADSIRVLTVRLGLAAAAALDPFAMRRVQLKWPNDLYVGTGKLAGVLVEARWRGATPEWLAIGVGVNVLAPPDTPGSTGLRPGSARVGVLASLVPSLSAAVERLDAALDDNELGAYASRDLVAGRHAEAPARGVIIGINSAAELLVATAAGDVALGTGSLVLSEDT
jgi:BirA family biotin operon repressor/biotin-[acetyl-CoA-carboxylase] ligase